MFEITQVRSLTGENLNPANCPVPFGLVIGKPIQHSLSPLLQRTAYHHLGLTHAYGLGEVTPGYLGEFLSQLPKECVGLSVTMPHKQEIIGLLDQVDGLAKAVGAVNTVVTAPGGIKAGFNTDVYGIVQAIREIKGAKYLPSRAVILGARATASSALAACGELKPKQVSIVARRVTGPGNVMLASTRLGLTPEYVPMSASQIALETINRADLVISTLPKLVADDLWTQLTPRPEQTLLDVVYDPWPTQLVSQFKKSGASIVPGWLMLLHQAVLQVQLFTSRTPDVARMRAALIKQIGWENNFGEQPINLDLQSPQTNLEN